jgi:hypothetical protein
MSKKKVIFNALMILFLFLFIATALFIKYKKNTYAQQSCVQILQVYTDPATVTPNTLFRCLVQTDRVSRNVACGVSINGSWPQNVCPSDQFFGNWRGNTAVFNCVLPDKNLFRGNNALELVAYDFGVNCGPETGKRISLNYSLVSDEQQSNPSSQSAAVNSSSQSAVVDINDQYYFQNLLTTVVEFLRVVFSSDNSTSSNSTSNNPTRPSQSSSSPTRTPSTRAFSSIRELLNEVGSQVGVPPAVLEGVMLMEDASTFNLDAQQVREYSLPGNVIPGCRPNQCSATGPMQMTIGRDSNGSTSCSGCCWMGSCINQCPNAWATYGEGNPCNLKDNVYAAARKLKNDSGAQSSTNWTQEEVYRAARRYYGDCTERFPGRNNMTYCEFVWWYYQTHK